MSLLKEQKVTAAVVYAGVGWKITHMGTPYRIKITENHRSFLHMLTESLVRKPLRKTASYVTEKLTYLSTTAQLPRLSLFYIIRD